MEDELEGNRGGTIDPEAGRAAPGVHRRGGNQTAATPGGSVGASLQEFLIRVSFEVIVAPFEGPAVTGSPATALWCR